MDLPRVREEGNYHGSFGDCSGNYQALMMAVEDILIFIIIMMMARYYFDLKVHLEEDLLITKDRHVHLMRRRKY